MEHSQHHTAKRLFFQTDLTKAEIAQILGISRSTLDNWSKFNEWDKLKQASRTMPMQLANNCYVLMGELQDKILAPDRDGIPVTRHEVNMLRNLERTATNLTRHGTLNAVMELRGNFLDWLHGQDAEAAYAIQPLIDDYITSLAKNNTGLPAHQSAAAATTTNQTTNPQPAPQAQTPTQPQTQNQAPKPTQAPAPTPNSSPIASTPKTATPASTQQTPITATPTQHAQTSQNPNQTTPTTATLTQPTIKSQDPTQTISPLSTQTTQSIIAPAKTTNPTAPHIYNHQFLNRKQRRLLERKALKSQNLAAA